MARNRQPVRAQTGAARRQSVSPLYLAARGHLSIDGRNSAVGLVGYTQLPISALPEVDYPTIQILTFYPGASPTVMATTVTAPLERQFGELQGLSQMTSTSSGGTSVIVLQFNLSLNQDIAEEEVQSAINASQLTRFSLISAVSYGAFQIPNNPNQTPLGDFGPANYNSLSLNENEYDTYVVNIASLKKKGTDGDTQFAVFSRYAKINFVPDVFGDLVFNDVASNVTRESLLNGVQSDTSYNVNSAHTLRGGFAVTEEQTNVNNISTVLPVDPVTGAISPTPFTHRRSKLEAWLEHRRLHSGRVETHPRADAERGSAL